MTEPTFRLNDILGHMKIVSVQERRGDKIYLGAYSIDYDRYGVERSRTEVNFNCVVDCGDEATAMSMDKLSVRDK